MNRRLQATVILGLAAAVTATAGCGGSNFIGGPSVTTVAVSRSATVDVKHVPGLGNILVTGTGTTLYLLTSDPAGGSNCTGPCSLSWPPLEVSGRLKAGAGVDPSLLSSFGRGGGRQVLYDRHALYTFEEDTGPGMVTGQGVETYGGTWWVVSPDGHAVTSTHGARSSS
jgi:predicted lipoprotein with Yx(FWY)xxD motif